ncbi:MAG: peptidoglycan DD-metalloendopeptidase family protein, partial [Gammaproteobacteria bacterium]
MTFRLRFRAGARLALLLVGAWVCASTTASEFVLVDHDDSYLYRLPYADEVSYAVIQSWGSPLSHTGTEHYTVDFGMPEGTPVHAAREGVVVAVEETHERGCWSTGCAQLANYVAIRHSDGTIGEYFHLQKRGVLVARGEFVARG